MIGKNEIHLNQASMVEAVQEYLDKRLATGFGVKVMNIETIFAKNCPDTSHYAVRVEGVEKTKEP